jgi:anti-sigma B factor antagonist
MQNFTITETAPGKLALAGEMTILDAAQIKTALLQALQAAETLEVDLSGVIELDTTGVQLMLMLQREARWHDKSLSWSGHSPTVARLLDLLNLGRTLDAPAAWS